MKKLIMPFLIALGLTLAGMGINIYGWQMNHHMPLAYHMFGGEITQDAGFGVSGTHIYSMEPGGRDSVYLRFEPLSFLFCLAVLFVIALAVFTVVERLKKKTQEYL